MTGTAAGANLAAMPAILQAVSVGATPLQAVAATGTANETREIDLAMPNPQKRGHHRRNERTNVSVTAVGYRVDDSTQRGHPLRYAPATERHK